MSRHSRGMLACAWGLTGAASLAWAADNRWPPGDPVRVLCASVGITLLCLLAVWLAAAFAPQGSIDFLRLDHFLPFLRRRRPSDQAWPARRGWQWAARWLPSSWLSDLESGRPGRLRRWLRALGPTWHAAPWRRMIQGLSLALFLYLLHYVCWPYTARPAPPARRWAGWSVVEFDQASGRLRLTSTGTATDLLPAGATAYLRPTEADAATAGPPETSNPGGDATETGAEIPVELVAVTPHDVTVEPRSPLSPALLDAALTGGVCELSDRPTLSWPAHYAEDLARKEWISAELFLVIDPLVSLSTAVASRSAVWSLASAATILWVCLFLPRGFCGYLCPLGTVIDLFDSLVSRRVTRWRVPADGWWVHVKYYLLLGVLVAALGGVLVSGYCAAIPVITRGFLFLVDPLQTGWSRGWHQVPPWNAGQLISLAMLLIVLGLGLLQPRFWCKYVCPSGAVFSLGNLLRVTERKVEDTCIHCNKCVQICPFDAIKPDFTTRVTDCTLCQTCGGVCPTHAIKFVERWNLVQLKAADDPPTGETSLGRRGFLSLTAGTVAALAGGGAVAAMTRAGGARLDDPTGPRPVRPPGSVPEESFLQLCIRCGECFKACPNHVLQPLGFQQGWEGLWTPHVVADWAGCESSCQACGQVCPTGAIRALPLEEKRVARMGLARVNTSTCLPWAGSEACQLCVDECHAAGYHAIEFQQVHTQVDSAGEPVEGSGFLAPRVLADRCVGCGLCQTRCFGMLVDDRGVLTASAIVIEAGTGKEDRIATGSYRALRAAERPSSSERSNPPSGGPGAETYLPDFLQ
ncbi:MAG: 4Fe-4S binding protein [Pirellulales bacterium]